MWRFSSSRLRGDLRWHSGLDVYGFASIFEELGFNHNRRVVLREALHDALLLGEDRQPLARLLHPRRPLRPRLHRTTKRAAA